METEINKDNNKETINTTSNIPPPPKPKLLKQKTNLDNLLQDKEIDTLLQKGFIDYEKVKKKISKLYIIVPSIIFLILLGLVPMFYYHAHPFLIILYIFVAIPIFCLLGIIIIWRAYKDKHRIKATIIKLLTNHYIIANIFYPNQRLKRRTFRTAKDFFGFDEGDYYIDNKAVWLDEENQVNLFYFYNIPNPLLFNFISNLAKFFQLKKEKPMETMIDKENNVLEVSYSSESIRLFRKDKLLKELHKGDTLTIGEIIVIVGILIIIVLQIVNLSKGQPPTVKTG